METTIRKPYDELRACTDKKMIDGLLTEIGLTDDKEKRLMYLYDVMGIRYTFGANDLTLDEKFETAKEELALQVWKEYVR
jgi:hypothetical protein